LTSPSTPQRPGLLSSPELGLYVALLAAALARTWALGAHLPFSPGVDEPEVMERAVRMMKTGDLNPHFFDYPSLYLYVEAVASTLRFLYGAMHGRWSALAQAPTEEFYLWGRAVTAMLGTATVWLLYRAGQYWDRRTALLAAVMLAVMPLHVRESHYTLTDVPSTFFVTLTLLLSLRAHERATVWSFALAGAAAGLAGATKYNAGLACVMPILACALTPGTRPSRGRAMVWVVLGTLIAFLVAAPYTLLDLPHFLNGFARLASDYRLPLAGADPVWVRELKTLRIALEWPGVARTEGAIVSSLIVLTGLAVAVASIAVGPGRLKWVLVTAFPIAYFYFVSRQNLFFARYLLPLIPSLSLLGAAGVVWIVDTMRRFDVPRPVCQAVIVILTLVSIVPPAYSSIGFNINEGRVWTTEQAYWWIRRELPKGTSIRFEGSVTVRLPPDYNASYTKELRTEDVDRHERDGSQYLVASSQVYGKYQVDPADYPEENRRYQQIFSETEEVARFTASAEHPGPELRILRLK
jgi:4-amino-4-deoxy-L-arabinose transferase-like glycosyltransferase